MSQDPQTKCTRSTEARDCDAEWKDLVRKKIQESSLESCQKALSRIISSLSGLQHIESKPKKIKTDQARFG